MAKKAKIDRPAPTRGDVSPTNKTPASLHPTFARLERPGKAPSARKPKHK